MGVGVVIVAICSGLVSRDQCLFGLGIIQSPINVCDLLNEEQMTDIRRYGWSQEGHLLGN
jgi:hypothetical protein